MNSPGPMHWVFKEFIRTGKWPPLPEDMPALDEGEGTMVGDETVNDLPERVAALERGAEAASAARSELITMVEQLNTAVVALNMWRDTGSVYKYCGVCCAVVPVTTAGNFVSHIRALSGDKCDNSGGAA